MDKAFKKFLDAILEIEDRWKRKAASRVLYEAKQKRERRCNRNLALVARGGFRG